MILFFCDPVLYFVSFCEDERRPISCKSDLHLSLCWIKSVEEDKASCEKPHFVYMNAIIQDEWSLAVALEEIERRKQ